MTDKNTFGNDETACRFQLVADTDTVRFIGNDDDGRAFRFTLNRLWLANLALDIERFLVGTDA